MRIDFPIRFFDADEPTIWLTQQGYITFDGANDWRFSNHTLPNGDNPEGMIAAWWDDLDVLGPGGHLKTQILGTAPNRILVVEWRAGIWLRGTQFANFQIWLFEGSSTIEFHYGELAHSLSATVGIENKAETIGYQVPLGGAVCNPSCNASHWPENSVVTFAQGPDLRTTRVSGPMEAFAGLPIPISAEVANVGGKPAMDFTVRFYVSPTRELGPQSIELVTLDGDLRSLQPGESEVWEASPRLPITLEEGQYYIIAEADPHRAVPETNRGDNYAAYGPFTIGLRAPNLVVDWVEAPDLVRPGESSTIRWRVQNTGNLGAVAMNYVVRLSSSNVNSPVWKVIGSGSIAALEMGQMELLTTEVTIPEDVEPGVRYVTVEINPDRAVFEHEYGDNFGISAPVVVAQDDFVVLTEELPPAQLQGHYHVRLWAVGRSGSPAWRMAEGSSLAPGLALVEEVGASGEVVTFLSGVPSKSGDFPFQMVVHFGETSVVQNYDLVVEAPSHELRVVTEHLAEAAFGFSYEDRLMAIGGAPPYTWELVKGKLPLGMTLRSDGVLSGRPEQDGTFALTVRVRDWVGRQAVEELELYVASPAALTCVTRRLEPLVLGESVEIPLHAAGGRRNEQGGYIWSSVDTSWLATEIGEETVFTREPPPGLELTDDGVILGKPSAFGSFLWTVKVRDAAGAEESCTVRLDVPRDRGLTVVTRRLPTAVAGKSYRAQLEASGGDGQLTWSEFGDGRVLEELELEFDATGSLSGTIPLSVLQGEKEREFTVTVRVRDAANRIGVGVVTLTVREPGAATAELDADEGGCQAGAGTAAPWAIALLCLVLLRRRR